MGIKVFRMVTGEIVIADIKECQTEDHVTLDNPLIINLVPEQDKFAVQFYPLNPFAQELSSGLDIRESAIIYYIDKMDQGVIQEYQKMTGGIITPTQKDLIDLKQ